MKINQQYEILTPNGFQNFSGVNKIKKNFVTIDFNNGISLKTSYKHLIYDYNGNGILAKNVKIGQQIKSKDGYLTVINIIKHKHAINLYDIVNAGENQIYYTNDIISHNCSFLGSGDNVIETELLIKQEKENCREPIRKEWQTDMWIWKDPEPNHRYVAGLDVSRGDSEDSTGFTIIDFDTWEQVAEYHGKLPPDIAAMLLQEYGLKYQAFTCIDITGGMGISTTRKLNELNYPTKLLYYDGLSALELFGGAPEGAIPGINFSARNNRVQIVAALEEAVRMGGFKFRSIRLTNELRKFVYVNGRPDHLRGAHDDCLKAGTLIKTNKGYFPIEQIKCGDLVLTHKGNYKPVIKTLKKDFDGEWYDFKFSNQLSLGLSYNHPIYGYSKRTNEFKWYFPNEWLISAYGTQYSNTSCAPRQISVIDKYPKYDNYIIRNTDYYDIGIYDTNQKLREIVVDKDFAKFLGLFLADGHAYKNGVQKHKSNIYHITIAFNTNHTHLIKMINKYLRVNLGIKTQTIIDGNSTLLNCSSKLLWHILNECYDEQRQKILPPFYLNLGDKLYYVLKYWLKGDGWLNKRDKEVVGCTTSDRLALGMRDIAASFGYNAEIRPTKRHRYDIPSQTQYWVAIKRYKLQSHAQIINSLYYGNKTVKIQKSNFIGEVYNLQVAEDESFIANGIVVHNCIMAIGMAIFAANTSFNQLHKNTAQLNAMAKSWKTYEKTHDPIREQTVSVINQQNKEFNQKYAPDTSPYETSHGRYAYDQYKWLFGVTPQQVEEYRKSGIEP